MLISGEKGIKFIAASCLLSCVTTVQAQITFNNVTNQTGFGNVTASYGASWGDINNDDWPDLFANNHARRNSIYLNNTFGSFADVGRQVEALGYWDGSGAWEDTHGGTWADIDNDGDQDLLVTTGICCNPQFYENVNGMLYYRSVEFGFDNDPDKGGRQPIWFDMDDDGLLEVALMSFYPAALMKQVNGVFQKSHQGTGFFCTGNQFGIHVDLDADGVLEILCIDKGGPFVQAAYDVSTLPFTDVTNSIPAISSVNDVVLGDFDNNLRNDMLLLRGSLRPAEVKIFGGDHLEAQFVNNDRSFSFDSSGILNVLLDWNKTFNNFTNILIGANGIHPTSESFTLDPGDSSVHGIAPRNPEKNFPELIIGYNQNTQTWDFQLYTANKFTYAYLLIDSTSNMSKLSVTGLLGIDKPIKPILLSNLPVGFQDSTSGSGLNSNMSCVSGVAGDFDNDMDLDIYLACRGGVQNLVNRLYKNQGNGNFVEIANAGGATGITGSAVADNAGTSDSVIMADYDADGLLDIVVTNGLNMRPHHLNGGPDQLFRNTTSNAGNWIEVDLVGTVANRDAIGAKVYATTGGVTQLREQNGGYHRWSQNYQRLHIGLAGNDQVDLLVEWPSGIAEQFNDVASNHVYRITEGSGIEQLNLNGGGSHPGNQCGAPAFNAATDKGIFLWKECGSNNWHFRASAASGFVRYIGTMNGSQNISNLNPVKIEGNDILNNTPANTIDFDLRTYNAWYDGFGFTYPCNATMTFTLQKPNNAIIHLGPAKAPVGEPFNLTDYGGCGLN